MASVSTTLSARVFLLNVSLVGLALATLLTASRALELTAALGRLCPCRAVAGSALAPESDESAEAAGLVLRQLMGVLLPLQHAGNDADAKDIEPAFREIEDE